MLKKLKKKVWISFFLLLFCVFSCVQYLFASPSGLNNIPTADVAPEGVLVLQTWSTSGENLVPVYHAGFKYGPLKGVEIGADGKVGSKKTGPTTLQFKCQLPLLGEDSPLMPLVGVENISTNTDKAGKINPYAVLTYDLEILRAHLGYNFQDNNDGAFAGLDKTFKLWDRDLVLRSDLKQTVDGHEALGSVGFLHVLPWNFVLESWISIPSESNKDETYTAKLNYVIKF